MILLLFISFYIAIVVWSILSIYKCFQLLITKARSVRIRITKRMSSSSQNQDNNSENDIQSESQSANLIHLAPENSSPQHIQIKSQQPKPKAQPKSQLKSQHPSHPQPQPQVQVKVQSPFPNLLSVSLSLAPLHSPSRPRLIISSITLQNFKSYADTQAIGPFHQNFTSIVGPNGSGKSNLIQSMLFIFGYKANWMRLNRLNQLIHNSSTMGDIEKASVQVQFKKIVQENDGKVREVQGAFSVRRVVKSSGVSKYYINKNEATQGEVKDRLKQQGIDLNNNRFLILQGEVEQISQMKQKSGDRDKPGLLQYLQEIIGSSIFIQQIENSVTEYNAIEQTKHQKGQLMKLSQIQLKNMSKNKQQAIKYVKKQKQIYQIHSILQQVIISNNNYQSKQYYQKLSKLQMQRQRVITEEKEKLKKQAQRIRDLKKNKNQIEKLDKQLRDDEENMAKMVSADKNINQEISFKSQDLVKYGRKNNQLDAQLARIISQSDQVKESLPISKEKQQKLRVQLEQMEQELQKFDKPQLKQKLKSLETSLKKLDHEIKTFSQKLITTKKSLDQKFKKSHTSQLSLVQLQHKLQTQVSTLAKISSAETQASKILSDLNSQLSSLSASRSQTQSHLDSLSSSLRQHLHQSQQRNTFSDMFQKIMQENIDGVLGRLGDLGTVGKGYEEVITTACGRLDNIVVRDMKAAQGVLDFLKEKRIGRVTCIILDKIAEQRRAMDREWTDLPNSVRLFDMIKPISEEVRIAFYFAISDTIYCENSQLGMEYAMKDERNRRRVISKKPGGYIIYELNGLMNGCLARSGGFTVKGRVKKPGEGNQIKEMEKLKIQYQEKISKIQQRYQSIKGQIETVKKDISQFKLEKNKIQISIAETKQQIGQIKKNSQKTNKNFEGQKQKIQKQIESISNHIQKLQKQKRQLNSQITQIQKQQRSHQNQKISRLRDNHKISKQQYQLLDKDIQKKVAILQNTLKRVQQNKRSKNDFSKKIDLLTRQIKKLSHQREQIQVTATALFKKISASTQKIQSHKKTQQQLKTLFQQQEKQVKESKIKIQKARQEVQGCKQKLEYYRQNIRQAEEQLKKQREVYKELSATYDFLGDLEWIQGMNVDDVKKGEKSEKDKPDKDTSVLLNQSYESGNNSMTKVFPIDRLLETSPFQDLSQEKLDPFLLFTQKLKIMLVAQNQNLKKMSGNNLQIITQYRIKFSDFKKKYQQFQAVRQSQLALKQKIQQLKQKRLNSFREGFNIINSKLKQVYQLLTRGGDAELELIDSLDPFSDGINFSVRPPKKAWKQINKLSGGQKTLSSLSLIFALHYYKPTPLYFMDEIDAALDFKNVSIVADYIKKRTKDAQFIIISLRNNMFQLADKLVGVYKTYDKTKIVHFVPGRMRNGGLVKDKENVDGNQN